jgi:hypothetical protein
VALVNAAARAEAAEVAELLTRASSPNVRCCAKGGGSAKSHATTALHAAAAAGACDVVRVLLEGGADPCARQSGLRILRPLHEAATVAVAEALLEGGAAPTAIDPREPELVWYHKQHRRPEVADVILVAARHQKQQQVAASVASPRSAPSQGGPSKIFPCMTSAEMNAAVQAWGATGGEVLGLMRHAEGWGRLEKTASPHAGVRRCSSLSPCHRSSTDLSGEDVECAICMTEIADSDQCILLPCSGSYDSASSSGTPTDRTRGGCESPAQCNPFSSDLQFSRANTVKRPHVFHVDCLNHWWSKSCRCPTCRRDVRQWLKPTPKSRKRPPTLPSTDKMLSDNCAEMGVRRLTPSSVCGFKSQSVHRPNSGTHR